MAFTTAMRLFLIVALVVVANGDTSFIGTGQQEWNTLAAWSSGSLPTNLLSGGRTYINNGATVHHASSLLPALAYDLYLDGSSQVNIELPGYINLGGRLTIGTANLNMSSSTSSSTLRLVSATNITGAATISGGYIYSSGSNSFIVQEFGSLTLTDVTLPSTFLFTIGSGGSVTIGATGQPTSRLIDGSFVGGSVTIAGEGVQFSGSSGLLTLNSDITVTGRLKRLTSSSNSITLSTGKTLNVQAGGYLDVTGFTLATGSKLVFSGSGTVHLNCSLGSREVSWSSGDSSNWTVDADTTLAWEHGGTYTNVVSGTGIGIVNGAITTTSSLTLSGGAVTFNSGSSISVDGASSTLYFNGQYPSGSTLVGATISSTGGAKISVGNDRGLQLNGSSIIAGANFVGGNVNVLGTATISAVSSILSSSTSSLSGRWWVHSDASLTVAAATNVTIEEVITKGSLIVTDVLSWGAGPSGSSYTSKISVRGGTISSSGSGLYSIGSIGNGQGSLAFQDSVTSTISGASFLINNQGSIDSQESSNTEVTGDIWVSGSGTFKLYGYVAVKSSATAYLKNTLTEVYSTGRLAADTGAVIVVAAGTTASAKAGWFATWSTGYFLVQAGATLQFKADTTESWIEGKYQLAAGGVLIVRNGARAKVVNTTWLYPETSYNGAGSVTVEASCNLQASADLYIEGLAVAVTGTLEALSAGRVYITGYLNETTNVTVSSLVTVNSGGMVRTSTDSSSSIIYVGGGSSLIVSGDSTAKIGASIWAQSSGTLQATSGFVVVQAATIAGPGTITLGGAIRLEAELTLASGLISFTGGVVTQPYAASRITINSGATVTVSGTNVTSQNTITVASGASLTFSGATSFFELATFAVGGSLTIASGTTLVATNVNFGTTTAGQSSDVTVNGVLSVAEDDDITTVSKIVVSNTGHLEVGMNSDIGGQAITFSGDNARLSMKAHPTRGFTIIDFDGQCTLAGVFQVDLNGYQPTTKVKLANFGLSSGAVTLTTKFRTTDIRGNDYSSGGRRLLASASGNVVYDGNSAYYDPDAAANSASSTSSSIIFATLAAAVALLIAA